VPVSILGLTLPALTFALTLSGQGTAIRLLRLRPRERGRRPAEQGDELAPSKTIYPQMGRPVCCCDAVTSPFAPV
jgi:hypothetical protein